MVLGAGLAIRNMGWGQGVGLWEMGGWGETMDRGQGSGGAMNGLGFGGSGGGAVGNKWGSGDGVMNMDRIWGRSYG